MMLFPWLVLLLQSQTPSLPQISFLPIPAWVEPQAFDPLAEPVTGKQYGGFANLLIEFQDHAEKGDRFIRRAYRIQNTAGLQNGAQVRFDFDPLTQELAIHRLVLHRKGEIFSAVAQDDWKLIQQETELDRFMYNGTFSAVAFLEGLQVGDTVEYAATIVRKQSRFGESYWGKFPTSYAASLNALHLRIVAPPELPLRFRHQDPTFQPQVEVVAGMKAYTWLTGTPGKPPVSLWDTEQAKKPDFLTVSAYQDWFEVQSQLAPHYEISLQTPWLDDWLQDLQARFPDRENQVLEAIRFVQDDIRYLGIEMGSSSHIPSAPQETFRRRFGDCKDKTQLLCTMLQKMGIPADPVLVDTVEGHLLKEKLPSPFVFNHVVTVFEWEGRRLGVDATVSHERGRLADRAGLAFDRGLVLNRRDRDLVELPKQAGKSAAEVEVAVDIPGWGDTAQLQVKTTYTGKLANKKRAWFGENSQELTSDALMTRFEYQFSDIEAAKPMKIEDHPLENRLVIQEFYRVPGFGNEEEQREVFFVGGQAILEYLEWPDGEDPTWAPDHPLELKVNYKIRLPERWPFEKLQNRIKNAVFEYTFSGTNRGKNYEFNWWFQSRKNHALGVSEERYREDLQLLISTVNPMLSVWINPGKGIFEDFWKPVLFRFDTLVSLAVYGGAIWLLLRVRRAYRRREWAHWQSGRAGEL